MIQTSQSGQGWMFNKSRSRSVVVVRETVKHPSSSYHPGDEINPVKNQVRISSSCLEP